MSGIAYSNISTTMNPSVGLSILYFSVVILVPYKNQMQTGINQLLSHSLFLPYDIREIYTFL